MIDLSLCFHNLDQKQLVLGIFVDLKKALDAIDHNILFNKLEWYGIRGLSLQWMKSYLDDRKKLVKLGDYCSRSLQITSDGGHH